MLVHFGVESVQAGWESGVVCIGVFDGVHRGHQAVISQAVRAAADTGKPCIVATFDRHPAAILAPDRCPPALATLGSNLRAMASLGVDIVAVLAFTKELSETSPKEFFQDVLLNRLKAGQIVVGHDFAFGKGRQGTPEWLAERIETDVVAPVEVDGVRVSSSGLRRLVGDGKVQEAARLLGRPYAIEGIVVPGEKVGRTLGFPTLNIAPGSRVVVPADGAYSGVCETPYGEFRAAVSVGNRPTFDGKGTVIEAHLIDYPGHSLYGKSVSLSFGEWLHSQIHFESVEELQRQIAEDVSKAAAKTVNYG